MIFKGGKLIHDKTDTHKNSKGGKHLACDTCWLQYTAHVLGALGGDQKSTRGIVTHCIEVDGATGVSGQGRRDGSTSAAVARVTTTRQHWRRHTGEMLLHRQHAFLWVKHCWWDVFIVWGFNVCTLDILLTYDLWVWQFYIEGFIVKHNLQLRNTAFGFISCQPLLGRVKVRRLVLIFSRTISKIYPALSFRLCIIMTLSSR